MSNSLSSRFKPLVRFPGWRAFAIRFPLRLLAIILFGHGVSLAQAINAGGTFFGQRPDPSKCRHYYVAAEPSLWEYAPSGRDEMCGGALTPDYQRERQSGKVRYFQYTDATFRTKIVETPSLGIVGPVLRGIVGEFLVVTFLNRTSQPLSMHPHGVRYDKDSEGANYQPGVGKHGENIAD